MVQLPHKKHTLNIERMQIAAVKIILNDSTTGLWELLYQMGLVILDLEPLEERRQTLKS